MAQAKKFGAFSGVFTPSILTILGVIMYLRLPWIVGQSGLWGTIAIVIVAHLISVTTGLSVSSIATDKKVKAGGNYYIISRSLGLPIGGTLGLALFVGLSFSVSLYLIGFSESLLGAMGMEITTNTIRIAGTIALLALTTITFISTALAIKTQYFVLAAIVISLLSVFFGTHNLHPATPHFNSLPNAPSWMVLFGIFFPAVTGFEAGVSMSGDLKDPKKSIPGGTIAAIVVGLLVYLGLPFFFAYTVDANSLANDTNVLLKISLVPALVMVGILSATFSSALGSILGAPRILQATSVDKITHRFFSKGHGKENEPRNALLLTFLIAWGGILIGELNIIARVVSMFFITTYGFLNMSCALESWASTDFRPDFKIPKTISIIGSLACFIVMIQLDFLAMIGATVVMGGIFLYLKRRELTLESGDTWEGVWSSVVRAGLNRLARVITHQRNWRPNIILFSGGVAARPHLVELGKWLIHKRGVLSDFELIENPKRKTLQPRFKQIVSSDQTDSPGIFVRQLEVADIYDGMENICQVYGFSGMEPNTVLMGWARNSRNPEKFTHLLSSLNDLDFNTLLLDYDRERGYGEKKQIDIWWRGRENNISLALALIRFILASDEWDDAVVRILIVTEDHSLTSTIYKNMNLVLEDYRIDAEVKVVQNGVERRSFEEIVKTESREADLVILGIPYFRNATAARFVKTIDSIVEELGTLLLINASSYFPEVYVGIEHEQPKASEPAEDESSAIALPELTLPADERIAPVLGNLDASLQNTFAQCRDNYLKRIENIEQALFESLDQLTTRVFGNLEKNLTTEEQQKNRKLLSRSHSDFLFQSQQILTELKSKQIAAQKEILEESNAWLIQELGGITEANPESLSIYYESSDFKPDPADSVSLKFFKFRKRLRAKLGRRQISQAVRFRNLLKFYLQYRLPEAWYGELQKLGTISYQVVADIQKMLDSTREGLLRIENQWLSDELKKGEISSEMENARQHIAFMQESSHKVLSGFDETLRRAARESVQSISQDLQRIDLNRQIKSQYRLPKTATELKEKIAEAPEIWAHHRATYVNIALLDLLLMSLQNRVKVIVQRVRQDIDLNIESNLLQPLNELCDDLRSYRESEKESEDAPAITSQFSVDGEFRFDEEEIVETFFREIREATDDLPETIDTFSEEAFNQLAGQPFEETAMFNISLRRLVEYLIEENFINPLRDYLENLPRNFQKAENVARDVVRLVSFQMEKMGSSEAAEDSTASRDNLESILEDSKERVEEECQHIEDIHRQLDETIDHLLNKTFEQMNTYSVTRSAANLRQYIRTQEGQKVLSKFEIARETSLTFLKEKLVRLWYQRSEGVLVARKLQTGDDYRRNTVYQLLNLREAASPKPEVVSALPFYYRQLFSGEPNIHPNFWIGRKKEVQLAETALKRFEKNIPGGLLVTGEEASGKTSLCYYVAHRHFKKENIFTANPPPGGSIEPAAFRESVLASLRANGLYLRGKLSQVYNALPQNSVMIFNDLEMWWERSGEGFQVIEDIIELMNNFSHKCFFMANTNLDSYLLMNKIQQMEDNFLGIIECQPFDAEELKDIILLRHRSTGLKMELKGVAEDDLSEWRIAHLFNSFFDYSRGNAGVALQSWVSHIEKVVQERLMMREPESPETEALEQLENDWIVILLQFMLHKRLTSKRLARILNEDEKSLHLSLNTLKRTGMIVENNEGVLKIDPYILPHLRQKFHQLEVL